MPRFDLTSPRNKVALQCCATTVLWLLLVACSKSNPHLRDGPYIHAGARLDASGVTVLGEPQANPKDFDEPGRLDCGSEKFEYATTLRVLPLGMPDILSSGQAMADHDGAFNSTDVVGPGEEQIPFRRFVAAAISQNRIFAAVEHGGEGYGVEYWSFELQGTKWVGNERWFGKKPDSLADMLGIACQAASKPGTAGSPKS